MEGNQHTRTHTHKARKFSEWQINVLWQTKQLHEITIYIEKYNNQKYNDENINDENYFDDKKHSQTKALLWFEVG